jgi:hypothetical protein
MTGMSLCIQNINLVKTIIEKNLSEEERENILLTKFKKIDDEIKEKVISVYKELCRCGFTVTASIPAYLFNYSEANKKAKFVSNVLINSLMTSVLQEKQKRSFKKINIYIVNRGVDNEGLKKRVIELTKCLPSQMTSVINPLADSNLSQLIDKIMGFGCWFVDQSVNGMNNDWLRKLSI